MQKAQHESSSPSTSQSTSTSALNASTPPSASDNVAQPQGGVQEEISKEPHAEISDEPTQARKQATAPAPRAYDRTGLYPPGGKAFRVWALLAWLAGVVTVLGIISAILNAILI